MRILWLSILSLVFAALIEREECSSQEAAATPGSGSALADESETTTNSRNDRAHGRGSSEHENRLAQESSPYLLQHAHNPVDWYPWGDEAFAKAKREKKMIFLSVGYAACHWCHVMERESFVDEEIAKKLNEGFVCIKVDREERPDVDQIYMTAVQMINGNGGWPMSVFLLPDGRPFWGGTYFPARDGDRGPSTGFLTIVEQIGQAWSKQPDKVTSQAEMLTRAVRSSQAGGLESEKRLAFDKATVDSVAGALLDQYDPEHGGFGPSTQGPKFPEPSNLVFLLDRWQRASVNEQQQASARRMLLKSLDGMSSGAMFDHLGGGFHRYSVDQRWQIPHFEKMLYDNGQLVSVYAAAYEKTGDEAYRYIIEATCDFVLRELRDDSGAFYSSLDADSEGEEGKFYRWTESELKGFESIDGYDAFAKAFRLDQQPNFEGEFLVPDPGVALSRVADDAKQSFSDFTESQAAIRAAMMKVRAQRVRPGTDTKILTAWNGLMIAGLADAGRVLDRKDYKSAAVDAMGFLLKNSRDVNGRLFRSYAGEEARFNAYIDDYAFFASGLISLHRALGDERLLKIASQLTDLQIELFWDEEDGGFFFTSSDHSELIVRLKDPVDSAVPSGASVTAENLMYFVEQTDREDYRDRLRSTLQSFVPLIQQSPSAAPRAAAVMAQFLELESESKE